MMDDVTIRLRLFAGSWEASAFNKDGQKRKAIHPNQGKAIYQLLRLLNAVDSETMPQPDQYVVPQWVKDCINQPNFHHTNWANSWWISQLLTSTRFESDQGVFTSYNNQTFVTYEGIRVSVDFTGLPLNDSLYKENLIQRCQRVGQAIMDAEKPKPIDPDEGLMSMADVDKLLAEAELRFVFDQFVDKLGRVYGEAASDFLTGTISPGCEGVFEDRRGSLSFQAKNKFFSVDFGEKPLSDLSPQEMATEILDRIRLVRQARAKALQEAASK